MDRAEFLKFEFIYACINLNERGLIRHLNEKDVINGKGKWEFLAYLRDIFKELNEQEILKLVVVKKYCLKCHPGKEILEFYALDTKPEYWRRHRRRVTIMDLKPEFAFAFLEDDPGRFNIEPCENSFGFQPGGRVMEWDEISRKVHGYFG